MMRDIQSLHFHKTIQKVRWEHYSFRYKTNNEWSFLGNGLTEHQMTKNVEKLVPYIRNSDKPFDGL